MPTTAELESAWGAGGGHLGKSNWAALRAAYGTAVGFPLAGYSGSGFPAGTPTPALNLDLTSAASAGTLTTTRASAGYAENAAGGWTSFATNAPRITNKGLLVEEARTNSIRNNSMTGAVPGTPGTLPNEWGVGGAAVPGMAHAVVGIGTEKGIDYIDIRFSGTPSGPTPWGYEIDLGALIPAVPAQSWAWSIFSALKAGSLTNVDPGMITYGVAALNGSGGYIADIAGVSLTTLTSALTRLYPSSVVATPALTVNLLSYFYFEVTGPYDFTLRIGWPQLELGAFVTSPIRTTTVAVTRAAEFVSLASFASLGFNATEGTLFADRTLNGAAAGTFPGGPTIDTVSAPDLAVIGFFLNATSGITSPLVRTGAGAAIYGGTLLGSNPYSPHKLALAYKANDFASCADGGAPATQAAGTVPTGFDRLILSQLDGPLSGYVRRVAYWPTRLTNAQLQSITA